MTISPICRALAALVFLVFAVPASNAQDGSGVSPQTGMAEARTLMGDGRFDEALALLRALARDHPGITNIHFLAALAAIGASQKPGVPEDGKDALLDEAIAALHGILVGQPGLVRVRLELARAFFLKGEDSLARDHFERVLASKPVAAVAINIGRFLNTIRARRRWTGSFGFTFAPDTNIGAVSEEEIIYIHGLPFRRDADTSASSGVGMAVWGGGEYQYPLNDRLRLRAGADGSRREYTGNDFDQTFVAGHAGPRWLVRSDTEVSLLASARQRWLATQPHSRELGVRFETEYRAGAAAEAERPGLVARAKLPTVYAPGRAGIGLLSGRVRVPDAAFAARRRGRVCARAHGYGQVAQFEPLAAAGRFHRAAPGVHAGQRRRAAAADL